jgi:hypothetical protein
MRENYSLMAGIFTKMSKLYKGLQPETGRWAQILEGLIVDNKQKVRIAVLLAVCAAVFIIGGVLKMMGII